MYALIEFGGKQFKVEEGSSIKVPFVNEKIGTKVKIDKILYLDDGKNKLVGNPIIKDISIDSKIESHVRGKKVIVFKFKRRKGYQKKNSHRQEYSILKFGKLGGIAKSTSKTVKSKSTETKVAPKKAASKKVAPKKVAPKKTLSSKIKESKE